MARVRAYGTPAKLGTKTITDNGIYTASYDGLDGFSQVDVSVLPVLSIKRITQNGTYKASDDLVDGYSQVVVDVPTPQPVIESKSITSNGTYTVPTGVDGFNPVIVNVPQNDKIDLNNIVDFAYNDTASVDYECITNGKVTQIIFFNTDQGTYLSGPDGGGVITLYEKLTSDGQYIEVPSSAYTLSWRGSGRGFYYYILSHYIL